MKTKADFNYRQAYKIVEELLDSDVEKVAIHYDYPHAYICAFPGNGKCMIFNITERTGNLLIKIFNLEKI